MVQFLTSLFFASAWILTGFFQVASLVRPSVTRWLDYVSFFGCLQQWKIGQYHKKLPTLVFKFVKYQIGLLKIDKELKMLGKSGEVSPYVVTLVRRRRRIDVIGCRPMAASQSSLLFSTEIKFCLFQRVKCECYKRHFWWLENVFSEDTNIKPLWANQVDPCLIFSLISS